MHNDQGLCVDAWVACLGGSRAPRERMPSVVKHGFEWGSWRAGPRRCYGFVFLTGFSGNTLTRLLPGVLHETVGNFAWEGAGLRWQGIACLVWDDRISGCY